MHALPEQHCAINIAMYQRRGGRWVLSETRADASRSGRQMRVGRNEVAWINGQLVLRICDRSAPFGAHMRGTICLTPKGPAFEPQALHAHRPHWWWPVAPCARIEVRMQAPHGQWQGRAYHDVNWGHEPLSQGFAGWSWQRLWHQEGTLVQYITQPRDAEPQHLSHLYRFDGSQQRMPPLAPHALPPTRWGLQRRTAGQAHEVRRMEDTPFYSRSQIEVSLGHERLRGMHEQLDLDRFDAPWVQFLLPFRMRRTA